MTIAVRKDNDAGRALRLVCELPGEVDSGLLARHLYPDPKLVSVADYPAWRAAVLASRGPREARASRLLSRLQERRLVVTAGAPRLADWYVSRASRRGYDAALRTTLLGSRAGEAPAILALVMRVVEESPGSVAALLGAKPSGRRQATWRAACELGVIVPPSRRWATEAGLALVASWEQV